MKNIWIFNQYNMPPDYGHLNRHFNFGKYLNLMCYNPSVFVGSYLHNTNIQIINDKSLYTNYNNCDFSYYFIKTCDYSKSKIKRVYAMFQFYRNLFLSTEGLEKPDVIIGSSAHPLAALAAVQLAKKHNCQSIIEVRDLWPESFLTYGVIKKSNPLLKLMYLGEKWIYKRADKLIFTMEGGKDYIVEKGWDKGHGGPININDIYHINNGVDLKVFDYNYENYKLEDKDLRCKDSFKVVYTGSIRTVNKVEKVLEVAKKLKNTNVKFLIWGDGDQVNKIKERIIDENIKNVVLKGNVDKKFIPYITSQADLNIFLAESNPLYKYGVSPNKLFDYLAAGKPILSTFKPGYSIIEKYKAGIEIVEFDVKTISEKILYFRDLDQKLYMQFCENARNASLDYSIDKLTKSLIDIIKS